MRDFIVRIGRIGTVVIITLISIAASLMLTYALMTAFGMEITLPPMLIAALVPMAVASAVSWGVVAALFRVHHLEAEIRRVATYDMVTGLMTRRAFFSTSESIHRIACRNKTPMSVLCMDIDDFKRINDGYGHSAGDAVLAFFGKTLSQCARKSDVVGRIGGEEFAMILPDTDLAGAINLAQKIRNTINDAGIRYSEHTIRFTVSFGAAEINHEEAPALEALLQQSDVALYAAKGSGKNNITIYQPGGLTMAASFS
jgi:diguanylate cyclase (GGDEF)-like protein